MAVCSGSRWVPVEACAFVGVCSTSSRLAVNIPLRHVGLGATKLSHLAVETKEADPASARAHGVGALVGLVLLRDNALRESFEVHKPGISLSSIGGQKALQQTHVATTFRPGHHEMPRYSVLLEAIADETDSAQLVGLRVHLLVFDSDLHLDYKLGRHMTLNGLVKNVWTAMPEEQRRRIEAARAKNGGFKRRGPEFAREAVCSPLDLLKALKRFGGGSSNSDVLLAEGSLTRFLVPGDNLSGDPFSKSLGSAASESTPGQRSYHAFSPSLHLRLCDATLGVGLVGAAPDQLTASNYIQDVPSGSNVAVGAKVLVLPRAEQCWLITTPSTVDAWQETLPSSLIRQIAESQERAGVGGRRCGVEYEGLDSGLEGGKPGNAGGKGAGGKPERKRKRGGA